MEAERCQLPPPKDIIQLATGKSNDIFRKIKTNIVTETIISVVTMFIFPIFFWETPTYFWLIIILMLSSGYFAFSTYWRYWTAIDRIHDDNLITSLQAKIKVLSGYIKQLNLYTIIFSALGFGVGYLFALRQETFDMKRIVFVTLFAIPFLIGFLWLARKYVAWMYGKYLNRLRTIYADISNEEEI